MSIINDTFIQTVKSSLINATSTILKIASVRAICNKEWLKFIALFKFIKVLDDYETKTLTGEKYNEIAFFLNIQLQLNTLYNFIDVGGIQSYSGGVLDTASQAELQAEIDALQEQLDLIGFVSLNFNFVDANQITCTHSFGNIPLEIILEDLDGETYSYDIIYNNPNTCTLTWNNLLTGKVIISTVTTP